MTRWLTEAAAHFTAVYGDQGGPVYVVLGNDAGERIRFTVPPAPSGKLSPMAEAILEALSGASGPVAPKVLARKAGYRYHSHFRAALTDLARRGLVARSPDGYRLAEGG